MRYLRIIIPSYLLVGIIIITFTQAHTQFLKDIEETKNAKDKSGKPIPFYKLLLFVVIMFSAAVLLWPILLPSWFGKKRTMLDRVQESGSKVIVSGYRRIGAQLGCPPTVKTTDEKIVEIYTKVGTAFHEAAKQRGEHIPALYLNNIVLGFLKLYEMVGDQHVQQHLQYEVEKYLAEGLRPDYKQELNLIDFNV
jgi:hypothetical protein